MRGGTTGPSGLLDATPGPVLRQALETLLAAHEIAWADPAARHAAGRRSRALLDQARAVLAEGLGVRPDEVTFHASGDQAARTALTLLSRGRRRLTGPAVTSAVEHSALLRWLRAGDTAPTQVPVSPTGAVDLALWEQAIGAQTPFAVLQSANQEVGTRQPLAAARAVTHEHAVPLLVDARAGLGRDLLPSDFDVLVADATTWGGPRLGLLVVRTGTRVSPHHPPSPHEGGFALDPVDVPTALAAAEAWQQTAALQESEGVQPAGWSSASAPRRRPWARSTSWVILTTGSPTCAPFRCSTSTARRSSTSLPAAAWPSPPGRRAPPTPSSRAMSSRRWGPSPRAMSASRSLWPRCVPTAKHRSIGCAPSWPTS